MRSYPFNARDYARARSYRRATAAGWFLLILAGLTLGVMLGLAI